MRSVRVVLASVLAGALAVQWCAPAPRAPASVPARGIIARLCGPQASGLAATIEWLRFEDARHAGRYEAAYARAEAALALAPGATETWQALARHLAFERGEPGVGKSRAERAGWFAAAIAALAAGERAGANVAELAFSAGALHAAEASLDATDCAFPGGPRAAWEQAAAAFARAERAGHPLAGAARAAALERAADH